MRILIIPFLLTISGASLGQTNVSDSLFVVTYTTGKAWDKTKAPAEQNYFKEHSATLSKLRKEGIIQVGMRFAEKGMILVKAPTFAAARELITSDPAIVNQLFQADIQRVNVFYDGCVERPLRK